MDLPINDLSSLGFDEGEALGFDDTIAQNLGVDSLDNLVFNDNDMPLELGFDGEETASEISDAGLLRMGVDVVEQLGPYRNLVSEALLVNKAKLKQSTGDSQFVVSRSEFPYIPEDVFSTFHRILVDMATDPAAVNIPSEQCAAEAIDVLLNATGWSPKMNRPEFISSFVNWHTRFRKIAGATATQVNTDDNMLSIRDLEEAVEFYNLNTVTFVNVTNFLKDEVSVRTPEQLDVASFGDFVGQFMQMNNLSVLTMASAYDCVMGYFGSEELSIMLGVSREELLSYSVGEAYRRLLLYELQKGIMYPTGLKLRAAPDFQVVYSSLIKCMQGGSIVAEISILIAMMMARADMRRTSRKREGYETMERFLNDLHMFLLAATGPSYKVNPVFYGRVKQDDRGFVLSYAINDQTKTVRSDNVLCDVFGNKTRTYCIPRILIDLDNDCTICPPVQLVTPLRSMQSSGRLKINGDVSFVFRPTLHWLAANHILVEEDAEESTGSEELSISSSGDNPILTTLLTYMNKFEDTGEIVTPVVLSTPESIFYSVAKQGGAQQDLYKLYAVTDRSGACLSTDGSMTFDSETGNMIVSYVRHQGGQVDEVFERDSYQEEYLGVTADTDSTEWSITDFVGPVGNAKPVYYKEYREAVRKLCELTAFDYATELQEVQLTIARDLYHVLGLSAIDEMLATQVLRRYNTLLDTEGTIDNFNVPSLSELLDILCGEQNTLHGVTKWDDSCSEKFHALLPKVSSYVGLICNRIDKCDLGVLAIQVICQSELRREADMEAYRALLHIPEIGSRLARLEDMMIVMHIVAEEGRGITGVFSRKPKLVATYNAQVSMNNVDTISNMLGHSTAKEPSHALPVMKRVVSAQPNTMDSLLQYFILERNMYAMLETLRSASEERRELYEKLLQTIGLTDAEFGAMTSQEFGHTVTQERISTVYHTMWETFYDIVERGLLTEVLNNNMAQAVKAFDLFNTFYKDLVGVSSEHSDAYDSVYQEDFLRYAGSFVISYCPVVDTSCGEIDGGATRIMAFVQETDNFLYNIPIEFLRDRDLHDLRVVLTGE